MFDEIFLTRLGAKLIYHEMFRWYQLQHAAVKIDAGLTMGLLSIGICFDYYNYVNNILSGLNFVYLFVYIILNKNFLRKERKAEELIIIFLRTVFYAYNIYLFYLMFHNNSEYFTDGYGREISIGIFSFISCVIVFIWISTIKCMGNFNKGFKNVLATEMKEDNALVIDSDNEY